MKKCLVYVLVAIIAASLVGISLNARKGANAQGDQALRVAAILPLTGNFAVIGTAKERGFRIAADSFAGRINVDLNIEDSGGDVSSGVAALRMMENRLSPHAFFVDLTPIAISCIPLVNEIEKVTFLGSAVPEILDDSPWVFRFFPSGHQEAEMIAEFLRKTGVDSIFVIHTAEQYGHGFASALKSLAKGYKVVGTEEHPIGAKDLRSILSKADSSGAARIILVNYGVTLPTILAQAAELGIDKGRFIGNIGFIGNSGIANISPELLDGIPFSAPKFSLSDAPSDGSDFRDRYYEKYNSRPTFVAAYAHDALLLLSEAYARMPNGDLTQANLREAIKSLPPIQGATGTLVVQANRDIYTDMILATYRNGVVMRHDEQ